MTEPFIEIDVERHRTYVDGRFVPSVTQILKQAGLTSPYAIDEVAAERGRVVHTLTAQDDVKKVDYRKVPKHLRGFLDAWKSYRAISGFVPDLIEHRVYHPDPEYVGTFDRYGRRNGAVLPVMLDIKTSQTGQVADVTRLQLVAYCLAHKTGPVERMAVGLRPDGRFMVKAWGPETFQADLARWLQIVATAKKVLKGA